MGVGQKMVPVVVRADPTLRSGQALDRPRRSVRSPGSGRSSLPASGRPSPRDYPNLDHTRVRFTLWYDGRLLVDASPGSLVEAAPPATANATSPARIVVAGAPVQSAAWDPHVAD